MKKTRILEFLIVVTFVAVAFLFSKSCDSVPGHEESKSIVDSLLKANDFLSRGNDIFRDSINKASAPILARIDSLAMAKAAAEANARKSAKKALYYASLYDSARAALDTAASLAACDSLRTEVDDLVRENSNLAVVVDGLIADQQTLLNSKNAIIVRQDFLIAGKDRTIAEIGKEFDSLYSDFKALQKKQRRGRWIDRAVGFGAGVGVGLIVK